MKRIPLTKGKEALVDDQDYEYLLQWKWNAVEYEKTFYAISNNWESSAYRMHRIVAERMGFPSHLMIDHINRNGLTIDVKI